MVTTFCLRLAFGMMAPMLLLPAKVAPPRFFRVQFLSTLALVVVGSLFLPGSHVAVWWMFGGAAVVAFVGSISWHTDEAPLGRVMFVAETTILFLMIPLVQALVPLKRTDYVLDDFTSGLLLGGAISAMLMGHSYLIAPTMSLSPLNRLLGVLAAALGLRVALACWGLYEWTRHSTASTLDLEAGLWLGARWLVGLIVPIGLTWMAWESARIRSTQSATGILYVVTILVFLGELVSMLLVEKTKYPM